MAKGIAKSFGFSRQVTKPVGGRRSPGHFCRFLRGTMCVSSRFCGRWLSVSLRGVRRVAAFLRIEDLRLADARLLLSLFHRDDRLEDNLAGRIPALMTEAGLADAAEAARMRSPFGALSIWRARR